MGKPEIRVVMIPMVEAKDMPEPVLEWMLEHDCSVHSQNDIAQVPDDENVFAQWLWGIGLDFGPLEHYCAHGDDKGFVLVGVYAT